MRRAGRPVRVELPRHGERFLIHDRLSPLKRADAQHHVVSGDRRSGERMSASHPPRSNRRRSRAVLRPLPVTPITLSIAEALAGRPVFIRRHRTISKGLLGFFSGGLLLDQARDGQASRRRYGDADARAGRWGWERGGPEMTRPAATERTRCAAPLAAARGICGTLRAVVPADALAEAPVASYDPSPVAVAIAPAANPAMAVGVGVSVGMETVIGAGHDGDAISHRMAMSVGSARPSRAAAHCDQRDACRRVREWRDRHCRGGNGGQPQQRDR